MTKREYLVVLCAFVPFGPARLELLVKYFGSAKEAWTANEKELVETGLSRKIVDKFLDHCKNFKVKDYFNELKNKKIDFLTKKDKNYPLSLKEIPSAPVVLYLKGEIKSCDRESIAIVGSRRMTTYGKEVTQGFASQLANRD